MEIPIEKRLQAEAKREKKLEGAQLDPEDIGRMADLASDMGVPLSRVPGIGPYLPKDEEAQAPDDNQPIDINALMAAGEARERDLAPLHVASPVSPVSLNKLLERSSPMVREAYLRQLRQAKRR